MAEQTPRPSLIKWKSVILFMYNASKVHYSAVCHSVVCKLVSMYYWSDIRPPSRGNGMYRRSSQVIEVGLRQVEVAQSHERLQRTELLSRQQ